jgi:hypothetical protein
MTDKPWESAVSQVSLAGRTEEIAAMWRPWKTTVDEGGDLDWLRGQLESLIESVADNWQGRDGAMFQQKAQTIGKLIDEIQRNYQAMWSCLNTSRSTLSEAKKNIPIPVFGANYLNGTPTSDRPNPADPKLDYGMLYHDYQSSSDGQNHYTDFKARAASLLAAAAHQKRAVELHGQGWSDGSQLDTDYTIDMRAVTRQGTPHPMNEDDIQRVANQAAEDWYNYNAPLANHAMENLRTNYAQQAGRLPPAVLGKQVARPSQIGSSPHGQPNLTGSSDQGSVSGAGASGPVANSGAVPDWSSAGSTSSNASNPSVATGHDLSQTGLSGIGSPTGTSSAVTPDGVGGWGSAEGGASGSYGGGGLGGILPAQSAVGARPTGSSVEPIGAASDPRSFVNPSGGTAGRSAASGLGMMGVGGGSSGERPFDEHHSWLTEDQDVFATRPDDLPPNLT